MNLSPLKHSLISLFDEVSRSHRWYQADVKITKDYVNSNAKEIKFELGSWQNPKNSQLFTGVNRLSKH